MLLICSLQLRCEFRFANWRRAISAVAMSEKATAKRKALPRRPQRTARGEGEKKVPPQRRRGRRGTRERIYRRGPARRAAQRSQRNRGRRGDRRESRRSRRFGQPYSEVGRREGRRSEQRCRAFSLRRLSRSPYNTRAFEKHWGEARYGKLAGNILCTIARRTCRLRIHVWNLALLIVLDDGGLGAGPGGAAERSADGERVAAAGR